MKAISPTTTKDVSAPAVGLSGVAHNAFTATGPALRIRATPVFKKLATRVNKPCFLSKWIPNSQKAPR